MENKIVNTKLAIIGAGPAGMTAALYAARAGLSPVIFENGVVGGQIANSSTVENYPGYEKISGAELAEKFRGQLSALGVEIEEFDPVVGTDFSGGEKKIITENKIYRAEAVIIAAGASPKKLPVENEEKFRGKGVHYCALCDGSAYRGKTVGVVGGGSAALEEALYLSQIAERVVIIRRKNYFHAEKAVLKRVESTPGIEIMYNADLVDVGGGETVEYALIRGGGGEVRKIPLSAVFGYIGSTPSTGLFRDSIGLNGQGYIITDENLQTNVKGVFAAGDVREKRYRQIVTAVSDGAIAALNAANFIQKEF
ncbi:MAG: FAD-dependent oxidoreductase [Ruminococcus sp.]|nr:FAD-dependent oxidoreductase [Ruminococcus sp.]MCM1382094.1 FAD-dependent oxidoreductase [Muribaculaceae bacterium]MCM1479108.1 FAD-dependent oxidoreductase [Muribaculaceae bacterium]